MQLPNLLDTRPYVADSLLIGGVAITLAFGLTLSLAAWMLLLSEG